MTMTKFMQLLFMTIKLRMDVYVLRPLLIVIAATLFVVIRILVTLFVTTLIAAMPFAIMLIAIMQQLIM
jgi:hypothetical protein